MDETPEELEQIRREAEAIDVHQYRKRFRALAAIALGALMAGLVWLVLYMVDSKRNPCERVRDHYCKQDPASLNCKSYTGILDESLHDEGAEMRANIKAQCLTKIERLKEDDNITVK
jgi:SHS2 domain-containing protein